ncbi:gamma-glutamyltranspeptidase [Tilletiopsis washingtonensis]|uniref:Glutathione hydrolase n=1 Tax=Tilletiopsis washingtonensis TaxID=58919 RepID=A0A316Z1E3_9BASI|nr:gamma-glutamyltranspeptidase [Tilletiopsis washingtonensis]PWN95389.1 gamma-glutamyltranspeptidase [Tilletiopsis washingtonensis]
MSAAPPGERSALLPPPSPRAARAAPPRRRACETLLRRLLAAAAAALLLLLVVLVVRRERAERREHAGWARGRFNGTPHLARGRRGAVASENGVCSDVGVDVLRDNGTAVDAAIATAFCVGTLNMFSSGIGGGGFMLVRDPVPCGAAGNATASSPAEHADAAAHRRLPRRQHCSRTTVIDFRETAPRAANATMYAGRPGDARFGGLSVGVPGEVAGLWAAHRRWGSLPWARLVAPSVRLAESARVSRELARRLKLFGSLYMYDLPEWSDVFVNPDTGVLLQAGETVRRPAYAETLRAIAAGGADAFYHGPVAQALVAKVQNAGGILTLRDLAEYRVEEREALQGRWGERTVYTAPAPACGGPLLTLLNVAALYPQWKRDGADDGLSAHRFVEASKFAFAQRTHIGDPAFLNASSLRVVAQIPSMHEAQRIRGRIDDDRTHRLEYYEPLFDITDDHGTQHLSTVDMNGQAVALTSTVNLIFGSGVLDPVTGVILNDEMDDTSTPGVPNAFGLRPSPFNYPAPGKRPLSSTSPTIIEHPDGSFFLSIGGSGGSRIFGAVAQVLYNLDWGMDLSAAIERPRLHHQLLPASVSAETTINEELVEALRARGHDVDMVDINMAVAEVQAVMREQGPPGKAKVFAASDSRKEGRASAY